MNTIHLPLTNKPYETIRIDTVGEETLITVYNINVTDIDLLIIKLQEVKAQHMPKSNIITINLGAKSLIDADEPAQMTAVLGNKPDPTGWYKNALQKVAAQPVTVNQKYTPEKEADPEMPKPRCGIHTINVIGVTLKGFTRNGIKHEGEKHMNENAGIIKNESIRIYGLSENRHRYDKENMKSITYKVAYDRTFKMGDTVEYDSYNLKYTGKIIAIGEKTIKIEHNHGGKVTQLDLHTFIWRNWDLDLKKIAEENANYYD